MGLPTLYLETTIPSYLAGRATALPHIAARQALTKRWWERKRAEYALRVSPLVLEEVGRGDVNLAAARLGFVQDVTLLALSERVTELTESILAKAIIPPRAAADAGHIAVCAVYTESTTFSRGTVRI